MHQQQTPPQQNNEARETAKKLEEKAAKETNPALKEAIEKKVEQLKTGYVKK